MQIEKKNCTGTKTWKHFVIFAETVGPRIDGKHISCVREMFQRHQCGESTEEVCSPSYRSYHVDLQ